MPEPKLAVPDDERVEDLGYLGREFLTWLLWRCDQGENEFGRGSEAFAVAFGARARLGATLGWATDLVLKGRAPAHGAEARAAVGSGHTLREAELRFTRGEREWRVTLVAETLDLRSAKLPGVPKDEAPLLLDDDKKKAPPRRKKKGDDGPTWDEKLADRLDLLEQLDGMVRATFAEFMRERLRPQWTREVVPALRQWVVDGLAVDG
jgi:hypothetical protein